MKNLTLYNEIKALVQEAFEAESNATAWKKIGKEKMAEARMLTATAKKMKANAGKEIDFFALVDFIRAELQAEQAPASQEDTDLTDYRPGDFPASENNSDEEETTHPDVNEEVPHESTNL